MCDVFNSLKLWNMKFIFENFETRDTWGPKWLPGYVRSTWMACLFSNSFTLKKWTPISKMWCRNSYYCMYNFGCKLLSYSILKFIFQSWNKLQFLNKISNNSFFLSYGLLWAETSKEWYLFSLQNILKNYSSNMDV